MSSYSRLWLDANLTGCRKGKGPHGLSDLEVADLTELILSAPHRYPVALVLAAQKVHRKRTELANAVFSFKTALSFEAALSSQTQWAMPPRRRWRLKRNK